MLKASFSRHFSQRNITVTVTHIPLSGYFTSNAPLQDKHSSHMKRWLATYIYILYTMICTDVLCCLAQGMFNSGMLSFRETGFIGFDRISQHVS
jgi:hypothetical protein